MAEQYGLEKTLPRSMNLVQVNDALLQRSLGFDFSGHDPFDGLNSKIFKFWPNLREGLLGLIWLQLHKRSFINFRSVFGIPRTRSSKGSALFILGLLQDYSRTQDERFLELAIQLGDWLLEERCDVREWKHFCWGYPFDWKARAFFVAKGKPNIISTVYVAKALLDLAAASGQAKYRESALDAGAFIVKFLYVEESGRNFFSYIPGQAAFVHNASLWGAAWVSTAAREIGSPVYRELALSVARETVKEQKIDGSWVYGTKPHHQFIDGFHTGYNLEALQHISEVLEVQEFEHSVQKGLAYYKSTFIEPDGAVRYYNNRRYPLDMHSVAQAIVTLLRVGGTKNDEKSVEKVIAYAVNKMYIPRLNRFCYQKHRFLMNKIDYMRWTQAWTYYSLALFNAHVKRD